MEILIYGTINSVVLALTALGFALVYGISRVPNFAHGALYVVSGFITWSFLNGLGLPYLVSIVLGMAITGVIGVVALAGAVSGYMWGGLNWLQRIIAFAAGLLLVWPKWQVSLGGIAVLSTVVFWVYAQYRKKAGQT